MNFCSPFRFFLNEALLNMLIFILLAVALLLLQVFCSFFKTWSEHINVQKALLPGLWSLLNAGGYGSARIAYKFLLPLLSKLVDQVQLWRNCRIVKTVQCIHTCSTMIMQFLLWVCFTVTASALQWSWYSFHWSIQ